MLSFYSLLFSESITSLAVNLGFASSKKKKKKKCVAVTSSVFRFLRHPHAAEKNLLPQLGRCTRHPKAQALVPLKPALSLQLKASLFFFSTFANLMYAVHPDRPAFSLNVANRMARFFVGRSLMILISRTASAQAQTTQAVATRSWLACKPRSMRWRASCKTISMRLWSAASVWVTWTIWPVRAKPEKLKGVCLTNLRLPQRISKPAPVLSAEAQTRCASGCGSRSSNGRLLSPWPFCSSSVSLSASKGGAIALHGVLGANMSISRLHRRHPDKLTCPASLCAAVPTNWSTG